MQYMHAFVLLIPNSSPNPRVVHNKQWFIQPFARSASYISSVRLWNSLPPDVVNIIVLLQQNILVNITVMFCVYFTMLVSFSFELYFFT